jgi:putative Ca2+/H+ antiporter (TMEM165/GDT1 family)
MGFIIGFLIVNSIGALAGNHAAERIPIKMIKTLASLVFIIFGLLVVFRIT